MSNSLSPDICRPSLAPLGPNGQEDVDDDRIAFASHESGTENTVHAEERAVQDRRSRHKDLGNWPQVLVQL